MATVLTLVAAVVVVVTLQPATVVAAAAAADPEPLDHFFATVNTSLVAGGSMPSDLNWLDGARHYRVLPGIFPASMPYHFDGLSVVMGLTFSDGKVEARMVPYASNLEAHYTRCSYTGAGTGPTPGVQLCVKNPAVNLLPINGQLWLTIDTRFWGRIDPDTLATVDADAQNSANTFILNAHPACDPITGECFVEHGILKHDSPISASAGVSRMVTSAKDISAELLSTSTVNLPDSVTLQHSHSPCLSQNYVIAKLDSFEHRTDKTTGYTRHGTLRFERQREAGLWLVMDRRTNTSQVVNSSFAFVNNHFWNCYEETESEDKIVVVETVAATHSYLDTYFKHNLAASRAPWENMFKVPQRCRIDPAKGTVTCENLLKDTNVRFDYPTFNPLFKMTDYKYFYAISPTDTSTARWFDRVIKVDRTQGTIVASWSEPGRYPTEADYIPRPGDKDEDSGLLLTVVFDSTKKSSFIVLLEAATLTKVAEIPLNQIIPFHAHGISCVNGKCHSNP